MKPVAGALALGLLASTCWLARSEPVEAGGPLVCADVSPEFGERARRHVAALVGFGARHTGSPGWRRAVDYVVAELAALGIDARRDTWTDPAEGLEFTNVIATLPGRLTDKVVIGCHHDTKRTAGHPDPAHNFAFVGANDSGSGVGLLLALAAELRDRPRRATVELVFFDGEESIPYEWDRDRALFGSRRYVAAHAARRARDPAGEPPIRAFVLLDMVGAADLQIDRETNSTPALHDVFARAATACGHRQLFFANSLAVTDDHVPFLDAGVPAIDLIDIWDNPQWHTPQDTLDTISAASLQAVGEVVVTALPAIEERFVPGAVSR